MKELERKGAKRWHVISAPERTSLSYAYTSACLELPSSAPRATKLRHVGFCENEAIFLGSGDQPSSQASRYEVSGVWGSVLGAALCGAKTQNF